MSQKFVLSHSPGRSFPQSYAQSCAQSFGAVAVAATLLIATAPASAQNQIATDEPVQAMLIARSPSGSGATMPLISEELTVTIDGQHATSRLKQVYHNRTGGRVEGQYRLQAGSGSKVVGFAYWNGEQKIVGEVFEKQTARRIYNSVTRRNRDPGLLEEIADGVFGFKIFPIESNEKKRVQIDYTGWLSRRGQTVRYRAPINHDRALISVTLQDAGPIAEVRSSTHKVHVDRLRSGAVRVQVDRRVSSGNEFILTYKVKDKPWTARAFVHKDKGHDGYFALTLPAPRMPESAVAAKDVTIVLDRSGSMSGAPLQQAKTAAANVVRRLGKTDRVNVVAFDDEVYPLFEQPRLADRQARERAISFIDRLTDGGGTDLALALKTSLDFQEQTKRPKVVLFLTDGQSDSRSTLEAAAADRRDVRIFTVGLGQGVNRPLLSRLAATKRGQFKYIASARDIEREVGTLYRQISRPLLVDLRLTTTGVRALRTYPRSLPDLFVEDEILITGRLLGSGPVTFAISGNFNGKPVSVQARAQVRDGIQRAWVGRLWAQSRVDHLLEELALLGQNQELQNEVIELALAYNFVTKYTSFLAIPESEITAEARNMMVTARERKRRIMAGKSDAAALADKNKGRAGGRAYSSQVQAQGRTATGRAPSGPAPVRTSPPPPPPPRTGAQKSYDFEDDQIDGALTRPDGEMVDTRSFASSGADLKAEPEEDADYGYAEVQDKRGGCAGCAADGAAGSSSGWLLFIVAFLAIVARQSAIRARIRILAAAALLALAGPGCDCNGQIDGGGGGDDAGSGAVDGNQTESDAMAGGCDANSCPDGFLCRYDTCVPDLGPCSNNDDCPGDSYCDANGECLPYGVPSGVVNDTECVRQDPLDGVVPTVQCEWLGPPAGDPTEGSANIYTAPIVADLNLDLDPNRLQPSIIVTTWESVASVRTGTLRVFDGRTCEEQMHIGGDDDGDEANRPAYGTQWAVGDLDGDVPGGGHPEIVGLRRTDPSANSFPLQLIAFRVDVTGGQPSLERMWYGRDCNDGSLVEFASNSANYGPGLWDLDDDGRPEILIDSMVFDADGCLLSEFEDFDYITHNRMNAVADVDLDGIPELVMADRIAEWDLAGSGWLDEMYFAADPVNHKPGHVAVVDLGQYSALPGAPTPNSLPEVIIVSAETLAYEPDSTGTIRAQSLDGTIIWGPLPLYFIPPETAGGHGGAPTASDFDGDGQVEFAAAANQFYTVYDPDCDSALGGGSPAERPGGTCDRAPAMTGLPDGILWAQLSQDRSSSGTGSSIFDFNGDGRAEAVYGDECYVRVYEGASGEVLYSAPASNGTGFELPTIVDVDGDFATEIVVARSARSGCPSPDPLFPTSGDAVSSTGFVVLRDPEDRWASSRPVWNQHAYHVTNVTDDARIPRTSEAVVNWTEPGLNNFRQNTQGDLGVLNLADLTVVLSDIEELCAGMGGTTDLTARVCNRGTNPVSDGVTVEYLENADLTAEPGDPGSLPLCTVETTSLLMPGECEIVACTANVSPNVNVFVIVDPQDEIADCHPGNNDGAGVLDLCVIIE